MHCNIASCSAILFSEKVAYSTIPLFCIPHFPKSLFADCRLCLSSPDTVYTVVWLLMTLSDNNTIILYVYFLTDICVDDFVSVVSDLHKSTIVS